MRRVVIEAWQGKAGPSQCHRYQAFGHASTNCFRPVKCVRCAGDHIASNCPRGRDEEPRCANCAKNHTANDRHCPVLRRIARKQGIALPGLLPEEPRRVPQSRPRAVVQEDGWTTIRGKGRQPAPPPPVSAPTETVVPSTLISKATTGAIQRPPANDAIERQTSQRSKWGRKKRKKVQPPPQAATSTQPQR
ncbi:unnamed protein product [Parnassius apollo]|uniref:(apollo) hypothetical protein n=1 Tax=Parnassius apollo TaxID=110799 RepID=A0A8S3WPG3_PARAO|nr:unnamed protein product [Parnassius apollo]